MKCFTASHTLTIWPAANMFCSPRRQNVPSTPCPIQGNHWPCKVGKKTPMVQIYHIFKMSPLKILDHTTDLHDSLSAACLDPWLSLQVKVLLHLFILRPVWSSSIVWICLKSFQEWPYIIPMTFGFWIQGTQPYSWWSWRTNRACRANMSNLPINRGSLVELKQSKQSNQLQIP